MQQTKIGEEAIEISTCKTYHLNIKVRWRFEDYRLGLWERGIRLSLAQRSFLLNMEKRGPGWGCVSAPSSMAVMV